MENNQENILQNLESKLKRSDSLISLFFRTVIRMTLFTFLVLVVSGILYVAGNYQKFLDITEMNLLKLSIVCSICLLVFSSGTLIISIIESILFRSFKAKTVVVILFSVFCITLSLAFSIFSRTALVIAAGY